MNFSDCNTCSVMLSTSTKARSISSGADVRSFSALTRSNLMSTNEGIVSVLALFAADQHTGATQRPRHSH